jgi:hypothetical protein
VATAVAEAASDLRRPLSAEDAQLLLTSVGDVPGVRHALPPESVTPEETPPYSFAATRVLAGMVIAGDKLPEMQAVGDPEDEVDAAAISAASGATSGMALWRTWRIPYEGDWPRRLSRVFLVETDVTADFVAVTSRIQDAVAAAGERHPQVESYPVHADLPEYQRLARDHGVRLWARTADVHGSTFPSGASLT